MKEKMIKTIQKQIVKYGYALELRLAQLLIDHEYTLSPKLFYDNAYNNNSSLINLRGIKEHEIKYKDETFLIRHCLLVEWQNNKVPWCFLCTSSTTHAQDSLMVPYMPKVKFINLNEYKYFKEIHPFSKYKYNARNFFELYKNTEDEPEESNINKGERILDALISAIYATTFSIKREYGSNIQSICFYYPLVIYDGSIYQAVLDNDNYIIDEVDSVMVSFMHDSYQQQRFLVPVMKESAFPEFLNCLDRVLASLGNIAATRMHIAYPNHPFFREV